MDPADAAVVDARESLHPVSPAPAEVDVPFDPKRLATLIRAATTNKPCLAGEPAKIEADVLNSLPKWVQAVVQTGCFQTGGVLPSSRAELERNPELQNETEYRKAPKTRSVGHDMSRDDLSGDAGDELPIGVDDLNVAQALDSTMKDVEEVSSGLTHAELTADNVGKYTELLKRLFKKALNRQQSDIFERDEKVFYKPEEVKTLLQILKSMEKNSWINRLESELLISLMNAFDAQVRLGLAVNTSGTELPKDETWLDEQASRHIALLDITICELIVMKTFQIDRRVLSEETIDNCFHLLHDTIRCLLLPCIDTSFATTASTLAIKSNETKQSTGCRSFGLSRVNLRVNKRARHAVERVSHVCCEFMDQLATLITSVKLADRLILRLSSSMVELFALDHSSYATSLQQSASSILRGIFLQYKPHRESLLEDIVGIIVKLPTAKRTLKTVKLANSNDTVQRISTLVVSLLQCCAAPCSLEAMEKVTSVPAASKKVSSNNATEIETSPRDDETMTLLEGVQNNARSFVRLFLRACWKKTDDRDHRVVLENFVDDLLVMFTRPEWVGAEVLLEALSSSLASILHANVSGGRNPENYQTLAALNLVGTICASIKRYQRMVALSGVLDDSGTVALIEEYASCLRAVLAKCQCSEVMLNIREEKIRELALKLIVLTHLQRHNFDDGDSMKLLILKFLTESETHWSGFESIHVDLEKKVWKSLWNVQGGGLRPTFTLSAPTIELALKSSVHLTVKRGFCGRFDKLLAHLMVLLSKGAPTLRARIMKCLRGIVDVDPMLMAESSVQLAVKRCCSDEKSSVREAAVDLIGTYILLQPLLLDKYFGVLAERIRDKGIKVRKSVCKTFKVVISMREQTRDIITEQELRRKSACMRCLVERVGHAAEDQAVINFIIDTFQDVWFGLEFSSSRLSKSLDLVGGKNLLPTGWTAVPNDVHEQENSGALSEVNLKFVSGDGIVAHSVEEVWSLYRTPTVTPASIVKNNDLKSDNSSEVAATIVEVIHGMPNLKWFTELIKRLLEERKQKTGAHSIKCRLTEIAIAVDRSEKIVDRLVDFLMDLQEGKLLKGVSIEKAEQQFVACLTALSAFCEAKPLLLARHLETIRVYLKEENVRIQTICVSMISNILSIKRVPHTIAMKLKDDLKFLVQRSSPSVVGPSVECLATLSTVGNNAPILLLDLLEQYYLCIRKYKEITSFTELSDQDNYVLQRALFVAGKIVGTTNIDNCLALSTKTKVLKIGKITESLYDLYRQFAQMSGNDTCAAKAVQGIGFLFPIRPRLFLRAQQEGLLSFLLTANTRKAKLQCLVSMKELLLFEEKRLGNGLATRCMNQLRSKEQQVQGDQEADASLIGNVMQAELENVLLLLLQNVPQIRKEAIACIDALLTQGLVNPLQCIPNLVALESDRVPDVRDAAFYLLKTLHERFQSQFHTPLIKGLRDSYSFQLSVYGDATVLGIDENEKAICLFGRLYTNCVKSTKSHESRFLKALVNQFTDQGSVLQPLKNKDHTTNTKMSASSLKYLCYLAQILASLPYEVEDEPLYIIYLVNRYASLRLGPVMDDLKKAFAETGIAPKLLMDDESDLSTVKPEEYSLRFPTNAVFLLASNGRTAFAIALLLRLKFTLKHNYELDNDKCATFKPSATDASVEAKERSSKRLLLPSVDDLCQANHPFLINWNLFMIAWFAAREDQKQFDIDIKGVQATTPKRQRRSRRASAPKKQKVQETDSNAKFIEILT